MAETRTLSAAVQYLGQILLADAADLSDAELVGRFVDRRDEMAFAALVRRYGGVVFGVCRRVLRHTQDAEDAFQATFLVFARNAAAVQRAGAVGNWLYGVAHNVARKAKATRHRRAVKEREAARRWSPPAVPAPNDLREVLDGELHALPDKYRTPVVLCDLMGLTTREAAAEVGCPQKTLGTRLSRGRSLLARRLTRRGVAISGGALATVVPPDAAAAVPRSLLESTVRAAVDPPAITPAVAALTQGAPTLMLLKSFKYSAVMTCGVVAAGLTIGPVVVAAHTTSGGSGRPTASAHPGTPAPVVSANPLDKLHQLVRFVHSQLGLDESWDRKVLGPGRAEAAEDKDAPSLSGTWERKEGELKLTFDKDVLRISPHGKDDLIVLLCSYTVDKEGRVKATITGFEGKDEVKEKVKDKVPVGTEFSFTWKAKGDNATIEDMKGGDQADALKNHLEGDYAQKK